jgi:putative transposase
VPQTTLLDIPPAEQAQMLAALRRARYGYLLALHVFLLCAAGRTPTEIASVLFCSRSSVYRIIHLYHAKKLGFPVDEDGQLAAPVRTTVLRPWVKRSLVALLKAPPRTYGWCRTRWSCAALALELHTKQRLEVSAWTVRRWRHALGWVWKRAKLVAKDKDPQRVARWARIRWQAEHVPVQEVMVFADDLDLHLWPKVGAAWMPKGSQEEVMTPGQNEKHSLAGALHLATGKILHGLGPRKNHALLRDLLTLLDRTYPERQVRHIDVVVDNYKIHKAKAVEQWLATHPRFTLRWLPTYCPRANPIERAFGDVHDKCTRNHKRKRLRDVISDVERHLQANGPWLYKLSRLYQEPEVTAAVERIAAEAQAKSAA